MFLLLSLPSLSSQASMFELKYTPAQTLVSFVPCTIVTRLTPYITMD